MTNTLLTAEEREAIEGRDAQILYPSEGGAIADRRRLLQAYSAMAKELAWRAENHRQTIESMRSTRDGIQRELMAVTTERDALSARCAGLENERDAALAIACPECLKTVAALEIARLQNS